MKKSTKELENILKNIHPEDVNEYLNEEKDSLIGSDFESYFKDCLRQKGLTLNKVFLRLDISDSYGYKLLSNQKHTTNRDMIIKLCYVANFDLYETNKALILYGMSALYPRIKKDAYIISLFNNTQRNSFDFDERLKAFDNK